MEQGARSRKQGATTFGYNSRESCSQMFPFSCREKVRMRGPVSEARPESAIPVTIRHRTNPPWQI